MAFNLDNNPNTLYSASVTKELRDENNNATRVPVPQYSYLVNTHDFDAESQLIRGTMSFSKDRMQELDPSYQGYTHIFCIKVPPVLTVAGGHGGTGGQITGFDPDPNQDGTGAYREYRGKSDTSQSSNSLRSNLNGYGPTRALAVAKNLKAFFELGTTSYSGTPDLTLNTSQVQVGWAERAYPAPTYSEYSGNNFNFRCLEMRGNPLLRSIEYYIESIADPNVKAAMMAGAIEDGFLLEPTLYNFTWSFMVVQTDQTLLGIQDISLWQNCLITSIDRSSFDWENGQIDIVAPRDIPWAGVYMPNAHRNGTILTWAQALLYRRLKYYRRYQDMKGRWLDQGSWIKPGAL